MAEDLMDKVFSFFAGEGISDEKANMLKQIGKELSQNKYARFFRIRSEEVDTSFSSFFFSLYKTIYPIKIFMQDEKNLDNLQKLIVESCMDASIIDIVNRLDTPALDAKAKTMQPAELVSSIQADVNSLISRFDESRIAAVNRRYEIAAALGQFVNFNFPGFFKKFDSHFADGSFIIEPKFQPIKLILIVNEIGEFLTVTQPLKPEDDWAGLLGLMKKCADQDVVEPEKFLAMIKTLREIHTSKIMELMVQYTVRNPVWQWKPRVYHGTIGEEWLEDRKAEADKYIGQINNARKNVQISAMTKEIFESTDLIRMEFYTPKQGEIYRRKELDSFIYAEGLNYLKAFLDDYVDKEIKELSDILLIRGQWTNNVMSREMSESLYAVLEAKKPIDSIDVVLSDDGGDGSRLRAAMLRIDRDKTQARYINSIIGKNNDEALEVINDAVQHLISIGKHLKNLMEDNQKKHPELIINWRELNLVSKEPMPQRMVMNFKRINYFIQLMHLCTH